MKRYLAKVSPMKMKNVMFQLVKVKTAFRKKRSTESISKSLVIIDDVLQDAKDFKCEAEVVAYALLYMQQNSNATPSEAILAGYSEWVH